MQTWQLQQAKAKFSEMVRAAQAKGPQMVSLHGDPAVVVISIKDYQNMKAEKPNFVEFMQNSPLASADLDIDRMSDPPRDIEL